MAGEFEPVSGIQGDFQIDGDSVAGIKSFKITKTTNGVLVPNYSSPVDDNGNMWPKTIPGLSSGKVTGEGQFDAGNPDDTYWGIDNGAYVTANLMIVADTPFGFQAVPLFIDSIEINSTVESQYVGFSFQATVNGICPPTSTGDA
jgi:hypothetical protein